MIEWANTKSEKRLIKLENTLSGTHLNKNIWIPQKHMTLDKGAHELT